ncbi:hypothetical protein [Anabaena azotica]|uniref:hypothetical protein n=1 Tax=Anabaena azotica TaxID=197653 RepID=UPI0039A5114D
MTIPGIWIAKDTFDGGEYWQSPGFDTDILEFRSGYELGASTAGCSRPTSIWKNDIFQTRYGCNWLGDVTFTFKPDSIPETKYDCINGLCVSSTTYNTPGFYQSLEQCEVNCGVGCSGVCISNSDWNQIQSKSNQLKNINCGG